MAVDRNEPRNEIPQRPWGAHAISGIIGAVCAVLAVQVDLLGVGVDREKAAFERIGQLESRLDDLQAKLIARSSELTMLRAQIEAGNDPMVSLYQYIDAIRSPAWIKVWVPENKEFRMLWINRAYERAYGVTREYYVGKLDKQVHGKAAAEAYYEQDMEALVGRQFIRVEEPTDKGTALFWKWYIRLPGDRDAVAGLQVQ